MDRKEVILAAIDRNGVGLEIGPSHNPVAPKRDGFKVSIIDHLSKSELIKKYENSGVNLTAIEEVDFIWRGERYVDLVGQRECYDWIIASHVIEHCPDLIGFLQSCAEVLKPEGVLSLAVPDARFCFDQFRPITGLGAVLDASHAARAQPTSGSVLEYYLNASRKGGSIAWGPYDHNENSLMHGWDDAVAKYREVLSEGSYVDVHVWCFTPNSFRLILLDLARLGLIPFQIVRFIPTAGCEFFVSLKRSDIPQEYDRLQLLEACRQDLLELGMALCRLSEVRKKKKKSLLGKVFRR